MTLLYFSIIEQWTPITVLTQVSTITLPSVLTDALYFQMTSVVLALEIIVFVLATRANVVTVIAWNSITLYLI